MSQGRLYIWSCYRQFEWLEIARLHNQEFPISTGDLKKVPIGFLGQVKFELFGVVKAPRQWVVNSRATPSPIPPRERPSCE